MDGLPTSIESPPVIVLRLAARAPDVDTFVAQYSRYLDEDELFIVTKNPQPPGTRLHFYLQLVGGEPLIQGKGTVTRVQLADPNLVAGMTVAFVPLDERSRAIIGRMQAKRAATPAAARGRSASVSKGSKMPPPPPPAALVRPQHMPNSSGHVTPSAEPSTNTDRNLATTAITCLVSPTPSRIPDAASLTPRADESCQRTKERLAEGLNVDPALATAADPDPAAVRADPSETAAPSNEPAAAGDHLELPANPFCEVSDGAIEYFVEWSVEQSTSEHPESHARFANVSMALPTMDSPPSKLVLPAVCLIVGLVMGGAVGWVARSESLNSSPGPTRTTAAVAPLAGGEAPKRIASEPKSPVAASTTAANEEAQLPPMDSAAAAATREAAALTISTRPSGASVAVDGKSVGRTPVVIKVSPGFHEVSLSKVRYAPVNSTVTAPGNLDLTLKRPAGTLIVESMPSAANVLIQGRPQGKTPVQLELAAFKRYDVQVAFAAGRTWRQAVYLKTPSTEVQARLSDATSSPKR